MSWTVYILSCADGTLYTGITNDLPRRLAQHEAGRGAKYTRGRGPFSLLYAEPQPGPRRRPAPGAFPEKPGPASETSAGEKPALKTGVENRP